MLLCFSFSFEYVKSNDLFTATEPLETWVCMKWNKNLIHYNSSTFLKNKHVHLVQLKRCKALKINKQNQDQGHKTVDEFLTHMDWN